MPRDRLPPLPALLAIGLVILLLAWLLLGDIQGFRDAPPEPPSAAEADAEPPRVEVALREAETHAPTLVLQGELEAHRTLELRARHTGRVAALPVAEVSSVEAGELLLEQAQEELPARLAQAEDALTLARAELAGADSLRQRGLISRTDYLRLKANVSAAAAELAVLRRQRDDTRLTAPFSGTLDRLDVEPGELLQAGEHWGRLVDDSRLTAVASAPQQDALALEAGQPAELRLLDGSRLSGEVSMVARRADEATRSFRVEVNADNPEGRRLAGASATLAITLPERRVHRLSPALLALNPDGELAVKHLDADDRVVQTPVTLVDADLESARVAGLPDTVRLITLGAGMVEVGEPVTPVTPDASEGNGEKPTSGTRNR
ncbi:efflux RND transporter periplasmic adaptor subunit [Halomonas icarae]|uniref:Efflux RND transporter periplasmic adaptor subunit n=1 Tax=Halomonas icarae TaxID=2691040 RepID=A0A7X5AMH4_9GAMM|nr:efflux RND transporter periplasmic adaptor subunit [Halomonas icarae]MDR5903151.1 efflux RND transporter periplasmic adaptor subunit [Halomonas icarae]NAW12869.1 efflux RND transporter periplasmic adaptor subunit [Halomonas icarae]